MEFRADMHCHSECSDGSLSPLELLSLAKEKGLSGLSITDHDTVEAYRKDVLEKAEELGIEICTGVEFSCQINGTNVHLLGYNLDLNSKPLLELCKRHQVRRKNRNDEILRLLDQHGFPVKQEDLAESSHGKVIGRPHIAQVMLNKGYVASIKEAFNHYIGDNKCCYCPGESFSVEETIKVIREAGGKAFIAHPHLVKKGGVLRALLEMPFDGIECYYALFNRSANEKWLNVGKDKGWLISGGSDFHGELKPQIPLGASYVDRDTFDAITSKVLNDIR
ncbi:phosphatase [Candidatus Aerophobetes bacterium]|uniref:Phosphatase n=1 Tax=Aerophobetes bacterium TaxID=2030807 RepID=A0A2A4YCG9_UNCAE|nr:MAG: phosphatase [Candidatus Aerophobetes bacterium]